MKNKELCVIEKDKLFALINKIIGLYRIVDDHCMIVDASIDNCERPRKGEMRELNDVLAVEVLDALESAGCPRRAMEDDDEDAMFEGILNTLGAEFIKGEETSDGEAAKLEELLSRICNALLSDKPVAISAHIRINTGNGE